MGVETTERGGREEESESVGRIRFVVRALKSGWENHDEDDDSGLEYKRVEFHMVDVDVDAKSSDEDGMIELRRDVLPSLWARTSGGVLISLGPSSYSVFGGLSPAIDESLAAWLKPPPERRHLYYEGAATINLSLDGDGKWEAFPLQCVLSFVGSKLYIFGSITLSPEEAYEILGRKLTHNNVVE